MVHVLRMTDLDLEGKRVLIREDLNVPVKNGEVTSDARIRASLPTIRRRSTAGARVILMSHLGRPGGGRVRPEEFSLAPVAARLSELLGLQGAASSATGSTASPCEPGEIVLFENVRFNKGEKKNSDELAQKMAALCDVFVMDAFGTAHRAEASTHGVAQVRAGRLRGPAARRANSRRSRRRSDKPEAAAGRDRRRLEGLDQAHRARDPARQGRPADRRRRHRQHLPRGDGRHRRQVAARGGHDRHRAQAARALARRRGVEIPLPTDVVVATEFAATAQADVQAGLGGRAGRDDPRHRARHRRALRGRARRAPAPSSGTARWACSSSTSSARARAIIAQAIARSPAFSLAGGGDTLAAIEKYGVGEDISYISTGGGAFLEFLEGKKLPAVEVLEAAGGRA